MNTISNRWRISAVVVLVLIAALAIAHTGFKALAEFGSRDFGITWLGAKILRETNVYEVYLHNLPKEPFRHPLIPVQVPSALMLLWPYTWLSWPVARVAWLVSNLAFTAGFLVLAYRRFLPGRRLSTYVIVSSLFVIGLPWRNLVATGQHLMFSLFLFMLALWLFERRSRLGAGVVLALSFFKYTGVFPLLPFFLRKRAFVPLMIAFAIHGVMTVLVSLAVGSSPVELVLQSLKVAGQLQRQGFLDVFALGAPAPLAYLASGILLAGAGAVAGFRTDLDDGFVMALLALVAGVIMYHLYYDYVLLIFPMLYAVRAWNTDRITAGLYGVLIFLTWYVTWVVEKISYAMGGPYDVQGGVYSGLLALSWYSALFWSFGRALLAPRRADAALTPLGDR